MHAGPIVMQVSLPSEPGQQGDKEQKLSRASRALTSEAGGTNPQRAKAYRGSCQARANLQQLSES